MKRILSIAISMLLISNIFGVALLADTAEETCYQDAAVGLNPPVTNDFDIGLDAENGSLWGATEVALLSQRFEKSQQAHIPGTHSRLVVPGRYCRNAFPPSHLLPLES